MGRPARRQAGLESRQSQVIEPEAVYDRAIGAKPKQPRPGIAGLRFWRHGTGLGEPEAAFEQGVGNHGVFVEPGRYPDRIGKIKAHNPHRELGRIGRRRTAREAGSKRQDRHRMGGLGIEGEQNRPGQSIK